MENRFWLKLLAQSLNNAIVVTGKFHWKGAEGCTEVTGGIFCVSQHNMLKTPKEMTAKMCILSIPALFLGTLVPHLLFWYLWAIPSVC